MAPKSLFAPGAARLAQPMCSLYLLSVSLIVRSTLSISLTLMELKRSALINEHFADPTLSFYIRSYAL